MNKIYISPQAEPLRLNLATPTLYDGDDIGIVDSGTDIQFAPGAAPEPDDELPEPGINPWGEAE